jgi:hypothetical protein
VSYPQQWPPQRPHYPQQWPPPYPPPAPAPRKTNVALMVVLALAAMIVAVPVALVGFFVVRDVALDGRGESQKATSLWSFGVVCDGGSISNAATYGKPYRIAAFARNDEPNPMRELTDVHWNEVTLDSGADYGVHPDDFQSTNVVACLSRKPGTEVKSRTCNLQSDTGEHVDVDYYAVQYDIELREARTGKRIEQLGTVDGPTASCPFLVWVNKRHRKAYAGPDPAAVNAKLADFAHK